MMSIPVEVLEDILSRLPVEPLLRFRCVSPLWRDLIDSPHFVKLHLNRSIQFDSHLNVILDSKQRPRAAKFEPSVHSMEAKALDHYPLRDAESGFRVWGSCNGLLCLGNDSNTVVIWNPSTRKSLTLPYSAFTFRRSDINIPINMSDYYSSTGYGFGYDSAADDYKVLRITDFSYKDCKSVVAYDVKIYSLKSNTWHRVEGLQFPYIKRQSGHFASGALHWAMGQEPCRVSTIGAFDLGSEEWRVVPGPMLGDVNCHVRLERFRESICLVNDQFLGYIDIWVMKEYGVQGSWTKLFSFVHHLTRPVYFPKSSGEVLMQHDGRLLWFDAENSKPWFETVYETEHEDMKNIEVHGVNRFRVAEVYMDSLVPLGSFGKMNDKKKEE